MDITQTLDQLRARIERHRDLAEVASEQENDWLATSHLEQVAVLSRQALDQYGVEIA